MAKHHTNRKRLLGLPALGDDDLLARLADAERRGRRVDAERVLLAAEVADRSRSELGVDGLAMARGFRRPVDLLESVTLASVSTLQSRLRLGQRVRQRSALDGTPLPPLFPVVAAALIDGLLATDAAEAITAPLSQVRPDCPVEDRDAAERGLVDAALGTVPDSNAPPLAADLLSAQARVWRAWLDPDGLEPTYDQALQKRRFTAGRRMGPLTRYLIDAPTEQSAQIDTFFNALLNPRTGTTFRTEQQADEQRSLDDFDRRTRDQRRFDDFIGVVDAAARAPSSPRIGGEHPTVLFSARAEDVESGRGVGFVDGNPEPLPLSAIRQAVCTGGYQRVVISDRGEILHLGERERVFTRQQRRAIAARDGGCIVPGCHVCASWCQIHHVVPWHPDRPGGPHGPTDVNNGVLLCWYHHRLADKGLLQIRMVRGVPEVFIPGRGWSATTKSPTRQIGAVARSRMQPPEPPPRT